MAKLGSGRRAEFEALPTRIQPKAAPDARLPARKHYCVTSGTALTGEASYKDSANQTQVQNQVYTSNVNWSIIQYTLLVLSILETVLKSTVSHSLRS